MGSRETPTTEAFHLLKRVFGFHPLAMDEVRHNAMRPRLNEFEGYNIGSGTAFSIGMVVMAGTILFQLWLFRRRGWL